MDSIIAFSIPTTVLTVFTFFIIYDHQKGLNDERKKLESSFSELSDDFYYCQTDPRVLVEAPLLRDTNFGPTQNMINDYLRVKESYTKKRIKKDPDGLAFEIYLSQSSLDKAKTIAYEQGAPKVHKPLYQTIKDRIFKN